MRLGGEIALRVMRVGPHRVQLGIEAPPGTPVVREELTVRNHVLQGAGTVLELWPSHSPRRRLRRKLREIQSKSDADAIREAWEAVGDHLLSAAGTATEGR